MDLLPEPAVKAPSCAGRSIGRITTFRTSAVYASLRTGHSGFVNLEGTKSTPTMREDEIGLRHNPVLRLSHLTRPTSPNCKKNLKSLSTSPKNRTTVEVRVHMPAPSHHDGPARLCTEPLVPCRRKQLIESTSAGGAFSASPASSLGYLKLLTANKRITRFPILCAFAQRGVLRVRR